MVRKVVFLDRDGTINEEVQYLHRPEDLKIIPGVAASLHRLRELGFLLVLITNQAGIGRGYYTEADCRSLNEYLNQELRKQGAELDAAYYCPHHPEKGIGSYKRNCICRKPGIGMFVQAAVDLQAGRFGNGVGNAKSLPDDRTLSCLGNLREEGMVLENRVVPGEIQGCPKESETPLWQSPLRMSEAALRELQKRENFRQCIDLDRSYMLGDKRIDVEAGIAFSLQGILLGSGYGKTERELFIPGEMSRYFESMEEAVAWIEKREREGSWTS